MHAQVQVGVKSIHLFSLSDWSILSGSVHPSCQRVANATRSGASISLTYVLSFSTPGYGAEFSSWCMRTLETGRLTFPVTGDAGKGRARSNQRLKFLITGVGVTLAIGRLLGSNSD